ncbi:MAG: zf-TFIIB domain-containing protein [Pseudomonadota bacterium]
MPLISSPIDGSPMREIERYGVKIDICQTSGGIWLDKGELEKIIMMIREEALHDGGMPPPPPPQRGYDEARAYQSQSEPYDRRPQRKKRDSIFDNLMDIFD